MINYTRKQTPGKTNFTLTAKEPRPPKLTHRLADIFGSMLIVIACSIGLASQASAVPISLDAKGKQVKHHGAQASQASAVPISLDEDSAQFLGVTPGEPANETAEAGYINFLIDLAPGTTIGGPSSPPNYQRSSNVLCFPTCPDATTVGAVTPSGSPTTGNFGSGFTYLLGKYDGPNFGDAIWYVAGLTGDFEIPDCMVNISGTDTTCYGLSHVAYFNPGPGPGPGGPGPGPGPSQEVPEPSTFILVGAGLLLARGATRRFARPSK